MASAKPIVLHLLTTELRPDALLALEQLLGQPDVAGAQYVCHLGSGPATRLGPRWGRIHVPAPLPLLRAQALRQYLRRLGLWDTPHPVILHAWSPAAASWARRLTAGHRPLIVEVDPGDDLAQLARWSTVGTFGLVGRSNRLRQRLLALGIPAARIRCIHPAVTVAPGAEERRQATRRVLRLEPGDQAVLVLPPVMRGGGGFVTAWATLLTEKVRPSVRLVVPADGPDWTRVWRLVEDCRHQWMARLVPTEIPLNDLLAAGDVAAYTPPGDAPLAGLAAAVVAGVPLVATEVPTVREFLSHGQTAWLCRPGDPKDAARAVLQALDHPDQSVRQARQARAAVGELFSPPTLRAAYADVYARLADRRPVAATAGPGGSDQPTTAGPAAAGGAATNDDI